MPTAVCVETARRRSFATAIDWPGWSRAGRDEAAALETLAAYAQRYAVVADLAGVRFPARSAGQLDVVERLPGGAGTEFGIPEAVAAADRRPRTAARARREAALLEASWTLFDRVVAAAPAELRKGPRGGGRDRDAIVAHVADAERAYLRKIGLRPADIDEVRSAVLVVLRRPSDGSPLAEKGWPAGYAVRRFAWHVLDHAWEIEDRSVPAA